MQMEGPWNGGEEGEEGQWGQGSASSPSRLPAPSSKEREWKEDRREEADGQEKLGLPNETTEDPKREVGKR